MTKNINMIRNFYETIPSKIEETRGKANRPLTLTEKILAFHLTEIPVPILERGKDYVTLHPDRVAMQDATAQMALLQFMHAGKEKTAVPTTVHCDHLILAEKGEKEDLPIALDTNREVYDFLKSVSVKYGIDCWRPGAGIIHQILLENYAFPGGMMIGTDSHTPNAGGLGMMAIGVGGADAVDVMAGMPWELRWPKIIGVKLTGRLSSWTSPKDIVLHLLGKLSVKGGTGAVIEYFGKGAKHISATGKATICNMGAELGATCSVFPYDDKMSNYLRATGRYDVIEALEPYQEHLKADKEIYEDPESYYNQVIEINLDTLEPYLNGPFTPDLAWPISRMKDVISEKEYPEEISAALIGSCTNSSYEDLDKAAGIAREALKHGIKSKVPFFISPGSENVKKTIERDGQLEILEEFGATILTNACGPCIGMWKRNDITDDSRNTIVTTFNRNFAKRADGNPNTHAFVTSPEIVMALAISGKLSFNPCTDVMFTQNGEEVIKFNSPIGKEVPEQAFLTESDGIISEDEVKNPGEVSVSPESERIQLLKPFPEWDGNDIINAFVLIKVSGKCTTDHISMAGKWLRFRGHLDNISDNLLLGGVNAFTGEAGRTQNQQTNETVKVPQAARDYKSRGISWVIIGDENYGEGSSREHAAMEPRYLGGRAVIARSFARIHETNLKKQGMLALTFADSDDYEKILADDRLNILGLTDFSPEKQLTLEIIHKNGEKETCGLQHSYNEAQIEWFKAGSALNYISKQNQ